MDDYTNELYQQEQSLIHQDNYSIQHMDNAYHSGERPTCQLVEEIFRASPFCQIHDEASVNISVDQPDDSKNFFIIKKTWRHRLENEEEHADIVAVYYCLDGRIYQCPDLGSLLKYRLYNCIQSLTRCYAEMRRYKSYSTEKGNHLSYITQAEQKRKMKETATANVLSIIGEGNVMSKMGINKAKLDILIRDMEQEFLNQDDSSASLPKSSQ